MSQTAIEVEIEDGWEAVAGVERLVQGAGLAALSYPSPQGEGGPEGRVGNADESPTLTASPSGVYAGPLPMRGGMEALTILLTSDAELAELNSRFRDKPYPTNVLSFPAPPNPERHLGDIAIAYETCVREAQEQGKTLADHLQHLVAHGVLHLVGYDHEIEADALVMEDLERRILAGIGVADPYAWRGEA
ncbi:MAG: ybeY [Caulobacteraceae bacterium]|nr:ybeY [Caulobacteraceae bacterium]